jgi:hypothetical protein
VLRPSSLPRALAAVTAAVLGLLGLLAVAGAGLTPSAAAAPSDPNEPLVVHMRSITPDYIPDHGPIVIRGTVTNRTEEVWTAINVHAFIGATPMTTSAELAAAAQTPVDADVGSRIVTPGTFDHIDSLAPGQTTRFVVRLPRSQLAVSAPGVYWFGVHVLGATAQGSSNNAVGRDRTFIPLVPSSVVSSGDTEDAALVVPVRMGVTRGFDGRVEDTADWVRSLQSGSLHSAIALGRAAHGTPLSYLLDPAVTDVVRQLAQGNPARTLVTPRNSSGGPSPSPPSSPSSSPSSSTSDTALTSNTSTETRVSLQWLQQLHQLLAEAGAQILGLPYGDMALDSAATHDLPLLSQAFQTTGTTLAPWHLPLTSVAAPPDGRVSAVAVASVPRATELLLPDSSVSSEVGTPPVVAHVDQHQVLFSSTGAAQGGPGPENPLSPLALRQRILSEAAVRVLDSQEPLIVQLPTHWPRRVPTSFFTGLNTPWLQLTTLSAATAAATASAEPMSADDLSAPQPPQLGPRVYTSANRALTGSQLLQSVLPGNAVLGHMIFGEVTGNASYTAQLDPLGSLLRMRTTAGWVDAKLDGIHVTAPESVTLASASGHFSALVSNDLDVPVTVKVNAVADPRLQVSGGEKVSLPAHGKTTVLLSASTHVLGVHTVTLELTNLAGQPLGSSDQFPIRAEQVSQLIWVIIGAGVALLFAAIVVRLARRIAGARRGGGAG